MRMTRVSYIICGAIVAGCSGLAVDLAASTYHWGTSFVYVKNSQRAVPLMSEQEGAIVVVVNKDNPIEALTLSQLARIYSGEVTEWPDGKPITAINRPIDSEVRRRFYHIVLHAKPTQKFFQTGSPIPFETIRVDSEASIARFVSQDTGAIGYCYARCANASVRVLRIGGRSPEDDDYALH